MKIAILCLGSFIILSSCAHIYFINPQPKNGKQLSEIPVELHGTWMDESGGIRVDGTGFTEINIERDSLNQVVNTAYDKIVLSDSLKIYKAEELYVINYKEKSNYWEIAVITIQENGNLHLYFTTDPEIFGKDKGLKLKEARVEIDGEQKILRSLDSNVLSASNFRFATFSGQMKINTLRNIVKPDHLEMIFNVDGTITQPKN